MDFFLVIESSFFSICLHANLRHLLTKAPLKINLYLAVFPCNHPNPDKPVGAKRNSRFDGDPKRKN